MLREVSGTRYVTPLREGGSLPGIVEADDDGIYVVKFRGAGQGSAALVAEVVVGELGRRIGVSELRDLGQLIALVAHDGARVRSTLTARAHTMRRHELANLQGQAGKADQSMQMAQVLIGLGYLLFIGYPAMVAVLSF